MRYIPLVLIPFAVMLLLTYATSDASTGITGLIYAVIGMAGLAFTYWLITKIDSFQLLAVWVGTATLLFAIYGVAMYLTNQQNIINNKEIVLGAWLGVVSLGVIGLGINVLCFRKSVF